MPRTRVALRPSIRKLDVVLVHRCLRAEEAWVGVRADAAEVQAIGVPAGLDGRCCLSLAVAVFFAGLAQPIELAAVEAEQAVPVELYGELGSARAMAFVAAFIDALRVVQQREQPHHQRISSVMLHHMKSVSHHPCPVSGTMDTIPVQPELAADDAGKGGRKGGDRHVELGRLEWIWDGWPEGDRMLPARCVLQSCRH